MKHCPEHPDYDGEKKPIDRWKSNWPHAIASPRNITCERCWIIYLTRKGLVRSH